MRIYVISLPAAEERRRRLLPALLGAGDVEVIEAVDGRKLGLAGLRPWCRRAFSARLLRDMMPSEIACTVSHGRAIKAFLDSGEPHGLILEDDALVDAAGLRNIQDIIDALPDLDLLKLGGADGVTAPGRLVATVGGTAIVAVTTFGVGAHGYVLSRRGAERLLGSLYPVTEPYDIFLRSLHRHRCDIYEAAPYPVKLDETAAHSTIGPRPEDRPRLGLIQTAQAVFAKTVHNVGITLVNARRFGLSGRGLRRWPTA